MKKKLKMPKLRHGWEINPRTRVVKSKKIYSRKRREPKLQADDML